MAIFNIGNVKILDKENMCPEDGPKAETCTAGK
jgi:hypothetical protein